MGERRMATGAGAALLLGVGAVGGFLGGSLLAGGQREPRPVQTARVEPAGEAASGELREVVVELRRAVELLAAAAERSIPAERTQPVRMAQPAEGATTPEYDVAELAAAMRDLAGALRASPLRGSGASAPLRPPAHVDRVQAFDTASLSAATEDPDRLEQVLGQRRRALMFTPAQTALDRFGAPDFVGVEGGTRTWYYTFKDGAGGYHELELSFHEGELVGFEYGFDDD